MPDSGLTRTLVRALGRHRAFEVLLGERELDADQAHDAGLVAAVVPTDRLHEVTRALAIRLASGPTGAIGLTKRLVNAAEDASLAESLAVEAAFPGPRWPRRRSRGGRCRVRGEARAGVRRPMNEVTTVGVLGAGTMGAGIAQVAAEAGLEVLLHDPVAGATDRAHGADRRDSWPARSRRAS